MNKRTSPLLINEPPLQVLPSLAVAIGIGEAIIVQQIHYWLGRSTNARDGMLWVYKTYSEWQNEFPFWKTDTIGRYIRKLEDDSIVLSTDKYNQIATDRTKWYTIDYDVLERVLEKSTLDDCKSSHSRALQKSTLLPETTQENTTSSYRPNIFSVYEQEIGPLTPLLGDQLKDIDTTYPKEWFADAVAVAVENNKRNLGYILAILRRWKAEGKDSGRKNGKSTDATALRWQALKVLAGTPYTEADIEATIKALQGAA